MSGLLFTHNFKIIITNKMIESIASLKKGVQIRWKKGVKSSAKKLSIQKLLIKKIICGSYNLKKSRKECDVQP